MRIYFSHAIRGKAGNKATHTQMKENCDKAIKVANFIRKKIRPNLNVYVPAESEPFVGIAFRNGYLNEREILEIDCKIIDTCEIVLIYVPENDVLQGGRLVEYKYAYQTAKPICKFNEPQQAVDWLVDYLLRI